MEYKGKNNRRFYRRPVEKPLQCKEVKLDTSILPPEMKNILEELAKIKTGMTIVVKGRLARLAFKLLEMNKKIDQQFIDKEKGGDLDIGLIYYSGLNGVRRIDALTEEIDNISSAMQDTLEENNVLFRKQDVEPIRGKFEKNGVGAETVSQILASRDMTINQVVLILRHGDWYICYTDLCQRHTINGIGMLNPTGKRVVRLESGIIVPTCRGWNRLLKFYAKGIVNWIYVTKSHTALHFAEMKRLQDKGELSGSLGNHGLVLAYQHDKADLWTKARLMAALYGMRFTHTRDFNQWLKEQEDLNGEGFVFQQTISVREALTELFAKNRERQDGQTKRRRERDDCRHEMKTITCPGCNRGCKIKKCTKCTRYIVINPESTILPCNVVFKKGDHLLKPWDLKSFFPLPQREGSQGLTIGDFTIVKKVKK